MPSAPSSRKTRKAARSSPSPTTVSLRGPAASSWPQSPSLALEPSQLRPSGVFAVKIVLGLHQRAGTTEGAAPPRLTLPAHQLADRGSSFTPPNDHGDRAVQAPVGWWVTGEASFCIPVEQRGSFPQAVCGGRSKDFRDAVTRAPRTKPGEKFRTNPRPLEIDDLVRAKVESPNPLSPRTDAFPFLFHIDAAKPSAAFCDLVHNQFSDSLRANIAKDVEVSGFVVHLVGNSGNG